MKKQITKETLAKLKEELEYLKKTKRKEMAERLKEAISFGDLKENAAYHEAKDSQGFLEGRIIELEHMISNSIITDLKSSDKVIIGSKIVVTSDDGKDEFTIVSPIESNPLEGKISEDSPIGKSFIGKRKGDICETVTPSGEKLKYKIEEID
ncbi:MAG: transcription elongation factor GreA [Candidatus Nealsonbacteria bacterium]|nr:transcription elongation factor GreA [Candidatus Nealsonbacteria bacterium]